MNSTAAFLIFIIFHLLAIEWVVSGLWNDFLGNDPNVPKSINPVAFGPANRRFTLDSLPFESFNDELYLSNEYMRRDSSNGEFQDKLSMLNLSDNSFLNQDKSEETDMGVNLESEKENQEKHNRFKNKKETFSLNRQQFKVENPKEMALTSLSSLLQKLKAVKTQINELKKLAAVLENFKRKLEKLNRELSLENYSGIGENTSGRREKKWQSEKKSADEKGSLADFGRANYTTYNNQYQIGNIFIFNQLPEKAEGEASKHHHEHQGSDVEITNQLTTGNIGELLRETLNNLKAAGTETTQDDCPSVADMPHLSQAEMDLLDEFNSNFSGYFLQNNITAEQIRQMSKIIDFVERYHGTMNGLADLSPAYDVPIGGNYNEVSILTLIKNWISERESDRGEGNSSNRRRKVEAGTNFGSLQEEIPEISPQLVNFSDRQLDRKKGNI